MKKLMFITLFLSSLMCGMSNETNGTITGYEADSLFLYKANSESTYSMTLLKSIPVTNGKFTLNNDSLELGLYCLSLQNSERGESVKDYSFLFMEPVPMNITISKRENKDMRIHASGSAVEESFMTFTEARLQDENRLICDSLESLFYEALAVNDTVEMGRIKEYSMPYYDKASAALYELIDAQMKEHEGTYFALYLYYAYKLPDEAVNTSDEIAKVRGYLNTYDEASKQTTYYKTIENYLARLEKCAVGSEAPEIIGVDRDDKPIRLSDFRGKYVIVDFWSSTCGWCRKETPNLQRVYQAFKDKDFTVLGVSSDFKKEPWIKAMEEDKSNWDQMLLPKSNIKSTMNAYCIAGIPHIILVDPNGIILAKELRGEAIFNAVNKNITLNL